MTILLRIVGGIGIVAALFGTVMARDFGTGYTRFAALDKRREARKQDRSSGGESASDG
jgi:hypothetical protein